MLIRFVSRDDPMANGNVEDTHHLLLTLFFIIQECNRLNVMIPRMQWVSYVTATYIHSAEIWLYLHYLNTIDCDEVFVRANCQDLGICCPLCFSRSRHWYSQIPLILYHKLLQLWQFLSHYYLSYCQRGITLKSRSMDLPMHWIFMTRHLFHDVLFTSGKPK